MFSDDTSDPDNPLVGSSDGPRRGSGVASPAPSRSVFSPPSAALLLTGSLPRHPSIHPAPTILEATTVGSRAGAGGHRGLGQSDVLTEPLHGHPPSLPTQPGVFPWGGDRRRRRTPVGTSLCGAVACITLPDPTTRYGAVFLSYFLGQQTHLGLGEKMHLKHSEAVS